MEYAIYAAVLVLGIFIAHRYTRSVYRKGYEAGWNDRAGRDQRRKQKSGSEKWLVGDNPADAPGDMK